MCLRCLIFARTPPAFGRRHRRSGRRFLYRKYGQYRRRERTTDAAVGGWPRFDTLPGLWHGLGCFRLQHPGVGFWIRRDRSFLAASSAGHFAWRRFHYAIPTMRST